jgi:hypothetical protein
LVYLLRSPIRNSSARLVLVSSPAAPVWRELALRQRMGGEGGRSIGGSHRGTEHLFVQ